MSGAGCSPVFPTARPGWVDEVLEFWFGELKPEAWFLVDPQLDATIDKRFADFYRRITKAPPHIAELDPDSALAAIIVLDQFPRNMYRGTAAAFGSDAQALQLAKSAVAQGYDRALTGDLAQRGRLFVYLPYEHSEHLADQQASVALIGALGDAELTRFAVAHLRIIERFGRFPHRNAALGRATTPEEAIFLAQPGSRF